MGVLIPTRVENVLAVGRSASYDSLAHSSARTVPVGVALGEAAGVMCRVASLRGYSFKEMSRTPAYYKEVQNRLMVQGVTLNDSVPNHNEENNNWSFKAIQNLRQQGFLSKIYKGKIGYGCNEAADYETIGDIASLINFHSDLALSTLGKQLKKQLKLPINEERLVIVMNQMMGRNYKDLNQFYQAGMISSKSYQALKKAKVIYNSHIYSMMSDLVDYLRRNNPRPTQSELIHNDLKGTNSQNEYQRWQS